MKPAVDEDEREVLSAPLDRRTLANPIDEDGSRVTGARGSRCWAARDVEAFEEAETTGARALDRHNGTNGKGSAFWGAAAAENMPQGVWGAYPQRFVPWALRELGSPPAHQVLHVCSGRLGPDVPGVRVDLMPRARPTVLADGRRLPFRDGAFSAVLIDPPYTVEYAEALYQTEYPRPSHLLREAARVLRPGGAIGFLHFLVPFKPPGCRTVRVVGITQGPGYRIRAWTVFRKEQESLFDEPCR